MKYKASMTNFKTVNEYKPKLLRLFPMHHLSDNGSRKTLNSIRQINKKHPRTLKEVYQTSLKSMRSTPVKNLE